SYMKAHKQEILCLSESLLPHRRTNMQVRGCHSDSITSNRPMIINACFIAISPTVSGDGAASRSFNAASGSTCSSGVGRTAIRMDAPRSVGVLSVDALRERFLLLAIL